MLIPPKAVDPLDRPLNPETPRLLTVDSPSTEGTFRVAAASDAADPDPTLVEKFPMHNICCDSIQIRFSGDRQPFKAIEGEGLPAVARLPSDAVRGPQG